MQEDRHLAVILFADIAGYTALMQQDEKKALRVINRFKEVLEKITPLYQGKIIQYFGDGCLLAFDSSAKAVKCAIAFQESFSDEPKVPVRIGLHLGDVVFKNENVFGDGVNIASRIESLSIPGAVLISRSIRDQVKNNSDFQLKSLGFFDFKNVEERIEVFALTNDGLKVPERKKMEGKLKKKNSLKRNIIFLLSFILLVIAAFYIYKNIFSINEKVPEKSIAVLPFVDMSAAGDQEYFSEGLSEELLILLSKIPELKVISRTSSFSFKDKNEDLQSIAQKLGVAHILEGSVRKDGKKIRVTAQLIRATDGSNLWNDTYDRELKDLFKLQDEIAGAVVKQLKLKLLAIPSSNASSTTIEVHNLILQGNYFAERRDKANLAKALEFYLKALALDSLNARIWAEMAECYGLQANWGWVDRKEGFQKARIAASRAIELDNNLAEGHLELGRVKMHDFDWEGAEIEFQKALDLKQGDADILRIFGIFYLCTGRFEEARRVTERSITLDPVRGIAYLNLGQVLKFSNHLEDAIAAYKKVLELNPGFPRAHLFLGEVYLLQGKAELALSEMQMETDSVSRDFGIALSFHGLGRRKESEEALKEFSDKYQDDWSFLMARLYAFRNEKDKTFEWLDKAYIIKDSWLTYLKGDPLFIKMERDPRYSAFLKRMNLPLN